MEEKKRNIKPRISMFQLPSDSREVMRFYGCWSWRKANEKEEYIRGGNGSREGGGEERGGRGGGGDGGSRAI
ncbi:hypothetical protein HZH68_014551 [Vespula germanica]|uniref:Uncharacterized protein n=1 Tax=Vespula germanica TaxID=30212 RepID=A0A834MU55_VESGE|nr:hypothetical protein HZH68_014551 [Vespula germanica]